MLTTPPAMVLFDVDGTLVHTVGKSRHTRAFRAAFARVYGGECNFMPGMHGMTDLKIFRLLAGESGLENGRGEEMARLACRAMVEAYQAPHEADGTFEALPGALALLKSLSRRRVLLGLVTGNAPEIARDKLACAGLHHFFSIGAFGVESEDRSALPPLAIARAEELIGEPVDRRRVFVVGDTPRDVACALDNGLRAVAVATGHIPMEDLAKTGAELVLQDLRDRTPLLRLLRIRPRS